jgi:hypothetical protein
MAVLVSLVLLPGSVFAAGTAKKKNPASKLFVSDVNGESQINTGEKIEDLSKRSVFNAEGTIIQTKPQANNAMVFSNGTGAYFDSDTRVEMRRFEQEPFKPNRTDMDIEPSVSQTQAFVSRGAVGLCTSKLVAGSNMTYQTPQGSVNIRGRKIVIEAKDNVTKISMLEGDSTVRAGDIDMGGRTLHSGEQAIIRSGPPGQPNIIEINRIPPDQAAALDDKVSMACMAKKTVYFEVKERETDVRNKSEGDDSSSVTAFDGDSSSKNEGNKRIGRTTTYEIVPVVVVPVTLPVNLTNSPSQIESSGPAS